MANWLYNGVELPAFIMWAGKDDESGEPYAMVYYDGEYKAIRTGLPPTFDAANNRVVYTETGNGCSYDIYKPNDSGDAWTKIGGNYLSGPGLKTLSLGEGGYIQWSSHDILTTDGALHIEFSMPISTACDLQLYGDAELQRIPVMEDYPCVAIRLRKNVERASWQTTNDGRCYDAIYSKTGFYIGSEGYLIDKEHAVNPRFCVDIHEDQAVIGEEWSRNDGYPTSSSWKIDDDRPFIWSNHTILTEQRRPYYPGYNPIKVGSKLQIGLFNPTDNGVTVGIACNNLNTTDKVYRVKVWVFPKGISYLDAPATFVTNVFGGKSYSTSHTFTGLVPGTEYVCYACILANDVATDHNAQEMFSTTGTAVGPETMLLINQVTATGLTAYLFSDGYTSGVEYKAEITVYETDTSKVAAFEEVSFIGNDICWQEFTGLTPYTDYTVAVDIYPAPAGEVLVHVDGYATTLAAEDIPDMTGASLEVTNVVVNGKNAEFELTYTDLPKDEDDKVLIYDIVGATNAGHKAIMSNRINSGSGTVNAAIVDMHPVTEYTATFEVYLHGVPTGVTATTTFTTGGQVRNIDHASFLEGFAFGFTYGGDL